MATITPNQPTDLTMNTVRARMDQMGGPAKQCRFAVRILPAGGDNFLRTMGMSGFMRDLTYLCESAELPGRAFDYTSVRYYGPNLNMPYNTKYNDELTLTFLTRADAVERQFFDDWMDIINPINSFDFSYPTNYYSEIQVYQLAEYSQTGTAPMATYQWSVIQAYPILVNPQPVTWADQDILRLSVTFTYRYWFRPGYVDQGKRATVQF